MVDKNVFFDELAKEIAGKDGISVLSKLKGKIDISEFKLAESLKLSINYVRNILYRFQDFSLVNFIRQKDAKKGWYIYYWTFDEIRAKELLLDFKRKKLVDMKRRLDEEEKGEFYVCPDKDVRLKIEEAMEIGFKCEECGLLLDKEDNSRTIRNLKEIIEGLKKDLVEVKEMKVEVIKRKVKKKRRKVAKKKPKKKKTKKKKVKKKVVKKKVKKKPVKKSVTVKKKPKKKVKKSRTVKKKK